MEPETSLRHANLALHRYTGEGFRLKSDGGVRTIEQALQCLQVATWTGRE